MRYYLRTLEGVGHCFDGFVADKAIEAYKIEYERASKTPGIKIKDCYILAWNNYINSPLSPQLPMNLNTLSNSENELNHEKLKAIRDFIICNDSGDGVLNDVANSLYNAFSINYYVKNKRNIEAREEAEARANATTARAIYEAEEKAQEEAERAAALKFEQEEAAEQAAAEIAKYEALRDEIATNLNYIENGQMILTTPEAMQVYKDLTGREYSEILARDEEAAAIYESEVKKMNEQKIDISPVVISSEHEYTIIDEDENTITYQDETGAVHVEQKAKSAWPWIIAGAAALFFLV